MKIRFLKDHLNNKEGDVEEVNGDRGNYFIMVGVAELADEKKEGNKEAEAEKAGTTGKAKGKDEKAVKREKNANAGPGK